MTKTVGQAMTPAPYCISEGSPIREAHKIMSQGHLRHLPVVDSGGRLVGVVSERDLLRLEAGVDAESSVPVSNAMSTPPFWAVPETPLAVVAAQMRARGIGCVVVVDGAEVMGIFTTTDALAELAAPLRPQGAGAWTEDRT